MNNLNVRLHQLRAMVAVVDNGSIRAAARALHLSQAALTKSLRSLEEETGLALLLRKASGVVLTEAGNRLLIRARLITRQLDLAHDEIRQALGEQPGMVCVGLTPYLTLNALGEAFKWFRKRYPNVTIQVMEGLVSRVLPGLRSGALDFAIVAQSNDVPAGEFTTQQLAQHQQTLVVRLGHPVLKNPSAALLVNYEWVLPGPLTHQQPQAGDYLRPMFEHAGVPPPAVMSRCDAMATIALVRSSDVVSVFPLPLLEQPESHGIVAISAPQLQPDNVNLVQLSLPDVPLTPAAEYLARCLRDACGKIT